VIFSASPDSFQNMTAAYVLEALVTKYYCQQFFNYFGHAAQIPHCLFAVDDNCVLCGYFSLLLFQLYNVAQHQYESDYFQHMVIF
jgi:hypothetical protein